MFNRLLTIGLVVLIASCTQKSPNFNKELQLDWSFSKSGADEWYPAHVPGSVQVDLLINDLIPDPYAGLNEDSIQWVEEENWIYKANLQISNHQLNYDNLELVFEGLDTYSNVYLNDSLVLETENMFKEYRVDIRSLVKLGSNELKIVFESPIQRNKEFVASMPYQLPTAEEAVVKVSPYVRKAAYQFGWDFAPRIVTMGIWCPVYLQAWNDVKIRNVTLTAKQITDTLATYQAKIKITAQQAGEYQLSVYNTSTTVVLERGENLLTQDFLIVNPELWWPNRLGDQHMYTIYTSIYDGDLFLSSDTTDLGVRTVKLIREVDDIGTSFRFEVNGQKVFMKGANWSPLSSFPGSIADSVYENRLVQVKEAHMNMLRVWGGGIYEPDLFYDLCDKYGILVWQDFMFANTMYPPLEDFTENVLEEVEQQVNRLVNHPSIAIWNGNNEIDVAWKNWGWQDQYGYTDQDSSELRSYYEELFHEFIPGVLSRIDPNANYSSTSPLSNWGATENFNHHSMHYWGVWHGGDRITDYAKHIGRFVSEYGFQSYPDHETLKPFTSIDDFNPGDNESLHQKSYVGNKLIIKEAEEYFGTIKDLEDFIAKSQKVQSLAYKNAIEAHRFSDKCDGTLFWQLSDCWPGPSWSVIDFQGNEKLAYEIVRDRYGPTIIVPQIRGSDLDIYLISDVKYENNLELTIELEKASGERVWVTNKAIQLGDLRKKLVYRTHVKKVLDGFAKEEVALKLTLRLKEDILDVEYVYFTTPIDYFGEVDITGSY